MNEQDQGPTNGVTAHLTIRDGRAAEAIDFYKQAFDATEAARMIAGDGPPEMGVDENDRRIMHAHLLLNGGSVMMNDDFVEFCGGVATSAPAAVTLHLQVDDADRWFDRAVAAGAEPTMPLENMFWGDRYGQVKDPFGHTWSIGAPVSKGEGR